MKQYVIDELRPLDYKKLKAYLDDQHGPAVFGGVYWIAMDAEMLTDVQREHTACQPHCVAIDLDRNRMACELLVRTQNRLRCSCIHYATEKQRNWLVELIDNIFNQLEIKT
jgi:hypothetical protein